LSWSWRAAVVAGLEGRGDQLVLGLGQLLDLRVSGPSVKPAAACVEGGDLVGHLGPLGLRLLQGGLLLLVAGEDRRADRDDALDAALDEVAGEDVGDGLVGQLGRELVGRGGERLHAGLALQQTADEGLGEVDRRIAAFLDGVVDAHRRGLAGGQRGGHVIAVDALELVGDGDVLRRQEGCLAGEVDLAGHLQLLQIVGGIGGIVAGLLDRGAQVVRHLLAGGLGSAGQQRLGAEFGQRAGAEADGVGIGIELVGVTPGGVERAVEGILGRVIARCHLREAVRHGDRAGDDIGGEFLVGRALGGPGCGVLAGLDGSVAGVDHRGGAGDESGFLRADHMDGSREGATGRRPEIQREKGSSVEILNRLLGFFRDADLEAALFRHAAVAQRLQRIVGMLFDRSLVDRLDELRRLVDQVVEDRQQAQQRRLQVGLEFHRALAPLVVEFRGALHGLVVNHGARLLCFRGQFGERAGTLLQQRDPLLGEAQHLRDRDLVLRGLGAPYQVGGDAEQLVLGDQLAVGVLDAQPVGVELARQ
jgi:hypothetical protein